MCNQQGQGNQQGQATKMRIQVRLFALARQLVGADTVSLAIGSPPNVRTVREQLVADYPALAELCPRCLFSVDAEYAGDDRPVAADSEIACIPPVSGG